MGFNSAFKGLIKSQNIQQTLKVKTQLYYTIDDGNS